MISGPLEEVSVVDDREVNRAGNQSEMPVHMHHQYQHTVLSAAIPAN